MVGVAVGFLVVFGWCALAVRLGGRIGYLDVPDDRLKAHEVPAVTLGGAGVFLGVHAGLGVVGEFVVVLAGASAIVLMLGLVDDRVGLSPAVRLAVEAVAGVLLVVGASLPDASGDLPWLVLGTLLVVFAVNAVNLFDGLDGLAGSAALVAALGMAWLAGTRGFQVTYGLVVAGAVAGFLLWNWHRARIFLGDNGSYVVGVFLAYGILQVSRSTTELAAGAALLGVFALDLVVSIIRRQVRRRPLFSRDRNHLYDQLRDRGLSVPAVAVAAAVLEAAFVLAVVGLDRFVGGVGSVLLLSLIGIVLVSAVAAGGLLRADPE
ncbi:MAG: glycosyltransferase family 4 protein [Acidimicrobiia bacterium]